MPEPVIIMRGFSSAPLEAVLSEKTALDDLKAIADLPAERLATLHKQLSQAEGFLDPDALTEHVRKATGDEMASDAIRRVIENLRSVSSKRILATLTRLKKAKRDEFPLKDSDLEKLDTNLTILKKRIPALTRFVKAQRLATLTGQQLESIEIVCDLRPIFDHDRKAIEGMMPYTRLRVVAIGPVGLPESFEAELTWQQVQSLAEKANMAVEKLGVLSESIATWLPNGLPRLPLTEPPEEEDASDA